MRFVLALLLIVLLGYLAGLVLPWWSLAGVAFLVGFALYQKGWKSFLAGFSGGFLLWLLLALWIDSQNESLLSKKIAQLFPLGGSSILLIVITALISGLVAGFAALTGSSLRSLLKKKA